jgi:membrane protease YdiL (CAAX protease family)
MAKSLEDTLKAPQLLRTSTVIYGVMSIIGLAIVFWGHKNLSSVLSLPTHEPMEVLRLIGIGLLGGGVLLVASYFFENWFNSYRGLKDAMTRILGPCPAWMAIYLAVISAVAEEVLFRGAIQPFAGLVLTSILFGLLHMGGDGKISAWSVWAVMAGLLLGWIFSETGSLWPPIIAHFTVNAAALLGFRRSYRNYIEHSTALAGEVAQKSVEQSTTDADQETKRD